MDTNGNTAAATHLLQGHASGMSCRQIRTHRLVICMQGNSCIPQSGHGGAVSLHDRWRSKLNTIPNRGMALATCIVVCLSLAISIILYIELAMILFIVQESHGF
jgi:hypothetical protein